MFEGVVGGVGIAVIVLPIFWRLSHWIWAKHTPQTRTINPPIHVNDPDIIQMLVPGIAARLVGTDRGRCPGRGVAAQTPSVVAVAFDYRVIGLPGQGGDTLWV